VPNVELKLIQRTVEAPGKEFLSRAEAAAWIGVSFKVFDALVRQEKIGEPVVFGESKKFWHWTQILSFIHTHRAQKEQQKPASK
jgi:hypothetical protein